tara:strand:- start:965 stop:1516 length:552 start_codon:yes stop_codon:yes gene_type:complete
MQLEMFEDDDFEVEADADQIKTAIVLAEKQSALETDLDKLENQIKEKKKELRHIQEKLLPEALDQLNLTEMVLPHGGKVLVKSDMSISVPKGRLGEITGWLKENGHGDIIKSEVSVPFGKGQGNMVGHLKSYLDEVGLTCEETQSVASGTLKALLKEQLEAGDLDKELGFFGAFAWKKAIVKR